MKTNKIQFYKAVASGNDFVVIDNRDNRIRNLQAFARSVCPAHIGIGADGLLLVENSKKADFKMRIINLDGSEAEACGNGFRCIALYAHQILGFRKKMKFETLSGIIDAAIISEIRKPVLRKIGVSARVLVKMADPKEYRSEMTLRNISVESAKKKNSLRCAFINTGVPHAVIFAEKLDFISVHDLGRAVRYHHAFSPRGTNVNFVEVTGERQLAIRTYERGVEGETLACGSGSTAAAVIGCLTKRVRPPVEVKTKSGERLTIRMDISGKQVKNVFLEGDAEILFSGNLMV